MIASNVQYFYVATVCGCVVRDKVHYQRAHIPLLLSPVMGIDYVFEDSATRSDSVDLRIDGKPFGTICTEKREMYGDILWLDCVVQTTIVNEGCD